jgi:signal transduction histidine kinase
VRALVAILGLLVPIATLAFGWSFAAIRETRFKVSVVDERERAATLTHFRWEMLGLGGLVALLAVAGTATLQAFRRAEELARERAMFVSAVSHELRTPLTTLRMHAEMLVEGLVSEERKLRVYGELMTETVRLTRLIENVLEASRLGEGRRPVGLAEADLRAIVATAVASMQPTIDARGFAVEVADGAPVIAAFDRAAVEIIVHNLVDNVLKYAAEHEPQSASVQVLREGGWAIVRVRDHGPGIAVAERARVFQRFYRIEDDRSAHRPGTGLGLALVRELSMAQGGEARIVPTEGRGTTVEVRLPLAPGASQISGVDRG